MKVMCVCTCALTVPEASWLWVVRIHPQKASYSSLILHHLHLLDPREVRGHCPSPHPRKTWLQQPGKMTALSSLSSLWIRNIMVNSCLPRAVDPCEAYSPESLRVGWPTPWEGQLCRSCEACFGKSTTMTAPYICCSIISMCDVCCSLQTYDSRSYNSERQWTTRLKSFCNTCI